MGRMEGLSEVGIRARRGERRGECLGWEQEGKRVITRVARSGAGRRGDPRRALVNPNRDRGIRRFVVNSKETEQRGKRSLFLFPGPHSRLCVGSVWRGHFEHTNTLRDRSEQEGS